MKCSFVNSVGAPQTSKSENATVTATPKIKTIYLAHPHTEIEKGEALQAKIEAMGIRVLNPFQRVEQPIYEDIIKTGGKFKPEHNRSIVEGDLKKIEEADAVVAMVTLKASVGTHMEVFYASRILHRKVFVWYDFLMEGKSPHPWYAYLTDMSFSEDELLAKISLWSMGAKLNE